MSEPREPPSLDLLQLLRLRPQFRFAHALRRAIARGYRGKDLRADLLAGLIVGIVAIPLSMALALAVGVPPQQGLYTAVIAGVITAVLGGCKFQVSGPTAAFVVILAPIVSRHGLPGLLTAGVMAGTLLIALGFAGLGRMIRFVPYPVTTGFTTGIAVVIAVLQLRDVFGLTTGPLPDHFNEKLVTLWHARGSFRWEEAVVASSTLAMLVGVPRLIRRVPAPLIAIAVASLAVVGLHALWPEFAVDTIGSRFRSVIDGVEVRGIPQALPHPHVPWGDTLSWPLIRELMPSAIAIALLGAIESLLSAVIADGMTGTKHEPNAEVVALGIANVVAPFFGGIAATGALARTATNIRSGARSPISAVAHSVVVLLAIVVLAPLLSYIPMAALAGLLLMVAWNMSEVHRFVGITRLGSKADIMVLVTCFLLTVAFDMVIAVTIGFLLAALLFMRRMAEITAGYVQVEDEEGDLPALGAGVLVYRVDGPLFFGAAESAMEALHAIHADTFHTIVLDLSRVPVIDTTGFTALDDAIATLVRRGKRVLVAGPLPRPHTIFANARFHERHPGLIVVPDLEAARSALAAEPA